MKIAIIGGAGAMARITILDLLDNEEVEKILLADCQGEKVKQIAASFDEPRIEACFVDGFNVEQTAKAIESYDVVINAAQLFPGLFEKIMDACLMSNCHYSDLGGLFWTTQKLLKRSDEFKHAGLTAILCIGSAPGITNILGSYASNQLDEVESVHFWDAGVDLSDMKDIEAFVPPYSIRTIMQEYSEEAVMYINGEYKVMAPLSGAAEADFPEPIGKCTCFHTLHSEPATFVPAFKHKGLRNCTWRLGLPTEFHEKAKFLGEIGFGSTDPLKAGEIEFIPREVLAAVVDKHIHEKLSGVEVEFDDVECLRAQVLGKKNSRLYEYIVDCIIRPHSRWKGSSCDLCTGVPSSIVAQMQCQRLIQNPGVWGPEVIDPEFFFNELGKREMQVMVVTKEVLV